MAQRRDTDPQPDASTRALLAQLRGERLQLRPPRRDDVPAIFAYAHDPKASRFLGWPPHRNESDTIDFVTDCEAKWKSGQALPWVIIDETGRLVGMIELQLRTQVAGVGYVIAPDAWGNGYASEALSLVSEALFARTALHAIWAVCDVENPASARVLEKCGYVRHGLLAKYRSCPNIGPEKRDFFSYVWLRPEATN